MLLLGTGVKRKRGGARDAKDAEDLGQEAKKSSKSFNLVFNIFEQDGRMLLRRQDIKNN